MGGTSRPQCGPSRENDDVLHNRVSMGIIINLKFHISGYMATFFIQRESEREREQACTLLPKAQCLRPVTQGCPSRNRSPSPKGRITARERAELVGKVFGGSVDFISRAQVGCGPVWEAMSQ